VFSFFDTLLDVFQYGDEGSPFTFPNDDYLFPKFTSEGVTTYSSKFGS